METSSSGDGPSGIAARLNRYLRDSGPLLDRALRISRSLARDKAMSRFLTLLRAEDPTWNESSEDRAYLEREAAQLPVLEDLARRHTALLEGLQVPAPSTRSVPGAGAGRAEERIPELLREGGL